MKLTTKSRYGTRLMVDLAKNYEKGPIHLEAIARRQNISLKYLEQIIIPLKKAEYINSVRGPSGGYVLAKAPEEITVGEIVVLLEDDTYLVYCSDRPDACERSDICPIRHVWKAAAEAMFEKLNAFTLADLVAFESADSAQKDD